MNGDILLVSEVPACLNGVSLLSGNRRVNLKDRGTEFFFEWFLGRENPQSHRIGGVAIGELEKNSNFRVYSFDLTLSNTHRPAIKFSSDDNTTMPAAVSYLGGAIVNDVCHQAIISCIDAAKPVIATMTRHMLVQLGFDRFTLTSDLQRLRKNMVDGVL